MVCFNSCFFDKNIDHVNEKGRFSKGSCSSKYSTKLSVTERIISIFRRLINFLFRFDFNNKNNKSSEIRHSVNNKENDRVAIIGNKSLGLIKKGEQLKQDASQELIQRGNSESSALLDESFLMEGLVEQKECLNQFFNDLSVNDWLNQIKSNLERAQVYSRHYPFEKEMQLCEKIIQTINVYKFNFKGVAGQQLLIRLINQMLVKISDGGKSFILIEKMIHHFAEDPNLEEFQALLRYDTPYQSQKHAFFEYFENHIAQLKVNLYQAEGRRWLVEWLFFEGKNCYGVFSQPANKIINQLPIDFSQTQGQTILFELLKSCTNLPYLDIPNFKIDCTHQEGQQRYLYLLKTILEKQHKNSHLSFNDVISKVNFRIDPKVASDFTGYLRALLKYNKMDIAISLLLQHSPELPLEVIGKLKRMIFSSTWSLNSNSQSQEGKFFLEFIDPKVIIETFCKSSFCINSWELDSFKEITKEAPHVECVVFSTILKYFCLHTFSKGKEKIELLIKTFQPTLSPNNQVNCQNILEIFSLDQKENFSLFKENWLERMENHFSSYDLKSLVEIAEQTPQQNKFLTLSSLILFYWQSLPYSSPEKIKALFEFGILEEMAFIFNSETRLSILKDCAMVFENHNWNVLKQNKNKMQNQDSIFALYLTLLSPHEDLSSQIQHYRKNLKDGPTYRLLLSCFHLLSYEYCLSEEDKTYILKCLFSVKPNQFKKTLENLSTLLIEEAPLLEKDKLSLEMEKKSNNFLNILQNKLANIFYLFFLVSLTEEEKENAFVNNFQKLRAPHIFIDYKINCLEVGSKEDQLLSEMVQSISNGQYQDWRYDVHTNPQLNFIFGKDPHLKSLWMESKCVSLVQYLDNMKGRDYELSFLNVFKVDFDNRVKNLFPHLGHYFLEKGDQSEIIFQIEQELISTIDKALLARLNFQKELIFLFKATEAQTILSCLQKIQKIRGLKKYIHVVFPGSDYYFGPSSRNSITIIEGDDPCDLILCGTDVPTCLTIHERNRYNSALAGYIFNGQNRLLIAKKNDKIISRYLLRLVHLSSGKPALYLDSLTGDAMLQPQMIKLAQEKAEKMNIPLYCCNSNTAAKLENPTVLNSFEGKTCQDYDHGSAFSINADYLLYEPPVE